MSEIIELNDIEVKIAELVGRTRHEYDTECGIIDRRISDRTSVEIDIQGMLGELAIAKYLNVYPDLNTVLRTQCPDLVYRGWSIDVKNKGESGYDDMITPAYTLEGKADIYINIKGSNPFEIIGWCYESILIRKENLVMLKVMTYKLPFGMLNSPQSLKYLRWKK